MGSSKKVTCSHTFYTFFHMIKNKILLSDREKFWQNLQDIIKISEICTTLCLILDLKFLKIEEIQIGTYFLYSPVPRSMTN